MEIRPQDGTVLIVDDERSNIALIKETLKLNNFKNILSTQYPTKTFDICKNQQIDLLILDINMPELDGFGVMKKLKKLPKYKQPSILIVTANQDKESCLVALQTGAKDHLTKPFNIHELNLRVSNLMEFELAQKVLANQNKILEEKVVQRTRKIEKSQLEIVRCLGRAAEYRDNETGLHIIRMSEMAALIAKEAGVNKRLCTLLLRAAPMHDIGKIGVCDKVLLKPDKLNKNEWFEMKKHPVIGAGILAGGTSEMMRMARNIALTHHEKWDGSGYPYGLAKKKINKYGRISAVADVFDALTSKRPYKEAWPLKKAVKYIQQQSGKQFDPLLVEVFSGILPKLEKISDKYKEPEDQ